MAIRVTLSHRLIWRFMSRRIPALPMAVNRAKALFGHRLIGSSLWLAGAALVLWALVPQSADAATRIKTIEWPLLQSVGTFTSGPQLSPDFVIPLPENGITVRTAYIEVDFQALDATLVAGSFIGLLRGRGVTGTSLGTATKVNGDGTSFGALVTDTNATLRYTLRHNATRAFTGDQPCLSGNSVCTLLVSVTGTTTKGDLSVKLVLTYEYDDASPTQAKTVRSFVGTRPTGLDATRSALFSHAVFMPEDTPLILASWYEVHGSLRSATTATDLQGLFSLQCAGCSPSPVATIALGDAVGPSRPTAGWRYLYLPPQAPATGGTVNTLLISMIGVASGAISAEYVVTYQYTFASSGTLQQTIRRPFGEINTKSPGENRTITLDFPESLSNVRSAYAVIRTSQQNNATTLLSMNQTSCSGTATTYSFGNLDVVGDGVYVLMSLTSTNWVDGAPVTICNGWTGTTGGARSMELVYTYEYTTTAGQWPARSVQTVRYGGQAGDSIQALAAASGSQSFTTRLFIPERLVSLRDVTVDAWVTGGFSDANFVVTVSGGNLTSITAESGTDIQLLGRLRCVTGSTGTSAQCPSGALISDAKSFTIGVNLTTTAGSNFQHLANAVTYATYLVSTDQLTSWTAAVSGASFGAPSLDPDSPVFVSDGSGNFYALSSTTGVLLSTFPTSSTSSVNGVSPLISVAGSGCPGAGNCLYAGTDLGSQVIAFQANATPGRLWSSAVFRAPIYAGPAVLLSTYCGAGTTYPNCTKPTTGTDRVFAVTRSTTGLGSVIVLNAGDGSLVSSFSGATTGCTGIGLMGVENGPVLDYATDTLYVTSDTRGTGGCAVWALRPHNFGTLKWQRAGIGSVEAAAAPGSDASLVSHVFVGASRTPGGTPATLYALNSIDGSTLYSLSTGCGVGCRFVTGVQAINGGSAGLVSLFFTTSNDTVWHVRSNTTGFTALWSVTLTGATGLSRPVVASGRVYVSDGQGRLHRLLMRDGAEVSNWRLITVDGYGKTATLGDPTINTTTNTILIGTSEGKVYAIRDP